MWVDKTLKCPDEGEWYAVVRVDSDGDTETLTYLQAPTHDDIIDQIKRLGGARDANQPE